MIFAICHPLNDTCRRYGWIRALLFIFVIVLRLGAGSSHAGPARPFDEWVAKLVVAENVEFPEAARRNMVPKEVFGKGGRLSEILKRHGLTDEKVILKYFSNNSICYLYRLNQKYNIALFGIPSGPTDMDNFITRASVFQKMSQDDFAIGLHQYFGMASISDPKVRTSVLKPNTIPRAPAPAQPSSHPDPPPASSSSPPDDA
jgi:hypothetical protein